MTSIEERLSEFVVQLTPAALPPATLERVRQHVLDAIACGLAGMGAEGRPEMARAVDALFGEGGATVLGDRARAAAGAALLNGFQIAAPTLGDVHRATLTHVLPEVLPASLAAAELHRAPGADLVAGVAAGMEVAVRVAKALDGEAYLRRAWHNPGIAGTIGAACAAARVARLDAREVRIAVGHATSQAAGTFAALGTSGVKVHQARGALSGLLATELAAAGLDASQAAIGAARGGLLGTYADGGSPERLTEELGSSYALEEIALRRWPGASSVQALVAAVLEARHELGLVDGAVCDLSAFAGMVVELPPRAFALSGAAGWETRLSALQSARWTAAVVLGDGEAWLDQTSAERRADEHVGRFAREVVSIVEDPALPATGARVTVRDRLGNAVATQVDIPPGDPRRPLSTGEILRKLERGAAAAGLADRASSIAAAVAGLESAPSIAPLTTALRR